MKVRLNSAAMPQHQWDKLNPKQRRRYHQDERAMRYYACPVCRAKPGKHCRTPKNMPVYNLGRWPLHVDRTTVHAKRRYLVTGPPRTATPYRRVVCPTCNAPVGETCTNQSGVPAQRSHSTRRPLANT